MCCACANPKLYAQPPLLPSLQNMDECFAPRAGDRQMPLGPGQVQGNGAEYCGARMASPLPLSHWSGGLRSIVNQQAVFRRVDSMSYIGTGYRTQSTFLGTEFHNPWVYLRHAGEADPRRTRANSVLLNSACESWSEKIVLVEPCHRLILNFSMGQEINCGSIMHGLNREHYHFGSRAQKGIVLPIRVRMDPDTVMTPVFLQSCWLFTLLGMSVTLVKLHTWQLTLYNPRFLDSSGPRAPSGRAGAKIVPRMQHSCRSGMANWTRADGVGGL